MFLERVQQFHFVPTTVRLCFVAAVRATSADNSVTIAAFLKAQPAKAATNATAKKSTA